MRWDVQTLLLVVARRVREHSSRVKRGSESRPLAVRAGFHTVKAIRGAEEMERYAQLLLTTYEH